MRRVIPNRNDQSPDLCRIQPAIAVSIILPLDQASQSGEPAISQLSLARSTRTRTFPLHFELLVLAFELLVDGVYPARLARPKVEVIELETIRRLARLPC